MPPLPELQLKIAGRSPARSFLELVTNAEVSARRGWPARFTLRLEYESAEELLDSIDGIVGDRLAVGTEVELLRTTSRSASSVLMGIVESVEVDLQKAEPRHIPAIVVRGHDKGHLLTRKTQHRAFHEMRASDVASVIADEHGLRSRTDSTATMKDYIIQSGQTDWDFLSGLASRIGFDFYVAGDDLHFQKAGARASTKLSWGRGLVSFAPTLNGSRQVVDVSVRGWDPHSKSTIEGSGSAGAASDSGQVILVGDQVVRSEEEATELAQSIAESVARTARAGRGVARPGKPGLRAGGIVDVTGVGETFGGKYYVDQVTHAFSPSGYSTAFELGGRNDLSASSHGLSGPVPQRLNTVVGVVIDNHDPNGLARVRVRFPWLDDDLPSSWARVATQMAGPERGMLLLPEVNDEVLVAFEHGDIGRPYVVGALWNGVDRPPLQDPAVANDVRLIRSRAGHELRFDDTAEGGSVEITTASGQHVRLDASADQITIAAGGGAFALQIDASSGQVTLLSPSRISIGNGENGPSIELDGASGEIVLSSSGDITIDSGASLKLKAALGLDLEAGTNLSAKAAMQASLEGSISADVKSGSLTRVTGGVVKIN